MSWQLKAAHRSLGAANRMRRKITKAGPDTILTSLDPGRRETPPPRWMAKLAGCTPFDIAGRRVLKFTPPQASGLHVVYIHGGGYIYPLMPAHWNAIGAIVKQTSATVWVPSYGLAPEHTVDDALPLLDSLYGIVTQVAGTSPVVLAGDSAGGGLALALAIRARDKAWSPVSRVVTYSPWVDLAMTNEAAQELQASDIMLRIDELKVIGKAWAGDRSLADPLVSPIHDSLAGLPELRIYQGELEVFTPDVEAFATKARTAGTDTRLTVLPGAGHAYVLAPWIPESSFALTDSFAGLLD